MRRIPIHTSDDAYPESHQELDQIMYAILADIRERCISSNEPLSKTNETITDDERIGSMEIVWR